MSEEQLAFYEMVIKADKTHDVNFKNAARELFIEVKELQQRIDKAIEYIKVSINKPQPFYEYLYGDENGEVQNLNKLLEILGDKE